jgi:putative ABC transport system permease protein
MSLISLSYEALKERRLRATLTILMVVMGGSLIVAVNGISTGTLTYIDQVFTTLGANLLIVTPRGADFEIDDALIEEFSRFDSVMDVLPFIQELSSITSRGDSQSIVVLGLDQSKLSLIFPSISVESGETVSKSDSIGILLGNLIVSSTEEDEPFTDLGQTVKIRYAKAIEGKQIIEEKAYNVRGILGYLGSGLIPVDQMAFVSISSANSFFGRHGKYDGAYVITNSPDLNDMVREELAERYNVNIISPKTIADTISRISVALSIFVGNIAAVSLIVASVGIITTLWTSMMERIREIGILKAIGFSNPSIMRLFLNEAVIIGALGGGLGMIFGVGLAYAMRSLFRGEFVAALNPIFTPQTFVFTWLLCLILSVISGFYPAWRASQLDPVVALRHE